MLPWEGSDRRGPRTPHGPLAGQGAQGDPCPVTCDSGEHGLRRHGEEVHRAGVGRVRPAGVRHPGTLMVTAAGGPWTGGNSAPCERDEEARGFRGSLYGNHCKHLGRGPARAGIALAPPEQTGALLHVLGWGADAWRLKAAAGPDLTLGRRFSVGPTAGATSQDQHGREPRVSGGGGRSPCPRVDFRRNG